MWYRLQQNCFGTACHFGNLLLACIDLKNLSSTPKITPALIYCVFGLGIADTQRTPELLQSYG